MLKTKQVFYYAKRFFIHVKRFFTHVRGQAQLKFPFGNFT